MTTEAQLAAYQATQDFLDSTGKLFQGDSQLMVDTLRRARAIIMQCGIALAPQVQPREGPVSKPLSFDDSLKAERSSIFESLTTKPGWANGMLFAVSTAKKMGCTNFEIEIKEAEDREHPASRSGRAFMEMYMGADFSDDWRHAAAACHKVTPSSRLTLPGEATCVSTGRKSPIGSLAATVPYAPLVARLTSLACSPHWSMRRSTAG